jgi:death-on-curing protein
VTEPIWIDERDALALHGKSLLVHGGAIGIRDLGLLQSALFRPRQLLVYSDHPNLISMAAAYTAGIIQNHPFIDGNKRVGFLVGILFLELNGYRFNATEEEAAQAVLHLAAGTLDEGAYVTFLERSSKRIQKKRETKA